MTKERLKEYTWIRENIKNLEDRLLEIDTKLQKTTNTLQTDIVQTTKDSDKWTLLIQKRMDVEELIKAERTNGHEERLHIEETIATLDKRGKLLMQLRYIDCLKWVDVSLKMNDGLRNIHRLHVKSLKELGMYKQKIGKY